MTAVKNILPDYRVSRAAIPTSSMSSSVTESKRLTKQTYEN